MANHRAKSKFRDLPIGIAAVVSITASLFTAALPSQATTQEVSLYLSAPGVQGSHVATTTGVVRENFNDMSSCTDDDNNAVGTVSILNSTCAIDPIGTYGGAIRDAGDTTYVPNNSPEGTGNKYMTTGSDTVTFTLTTPVKYVGLWWSAGNASNFVSFYSGDALLARVSAQDIIDKIGTSTSTRTLSPVSSSNFSSADYFGNPRSRTLASGEAFAYLNLFLSGPISATRVVFSGSGFEFDNLVTATTDQTVQDPMVLMSTRAVQSIEWAPTNVAIEVGNSPVTPSSLAVVTSPASGGGAISYSIVSAGGTGCSVNSSTGRLTYSSAGSCVVRATAAEVNGVGGATSYFSATKDVTFTILPISIPGTPAAPTAVAGNESATVTVSRGNTGGAPASYLVTSDPDGATCTVTAPATSCLVTGLTNGTPYTFTATATNTSGTSQTASAASNSVTPAAPVINTPSSGNSYQPPLQPVSVAEVKLTAAIKPNKSIIRVKLKEPTVSANKADVKVRLLDFNGKLIRELTIPVEGDTSTVELEVDLPVGDFNADARAVNAAGVSATVAANSTLVKKVFFTKKPSSKLPILQGVKASEQVLFAPNSAVLTSKAKAALRTFASKVKNTNSRLALTGFSVRWVKGSKVEYNLAQQRALKVGQFLKSQGVDNWVYYAAFGGVATNDKKPQNRKVELRLLN